MDALSTTSLSRAAKLADAAARQRAASEPSVRERSNALLEEQTLASAARRYLKHRRQRDSMLPDGLFADPAWDLLLDLFAAGVERTPVPVTSACIAAAVPTSTALRWIGALEEHGLVRRIADAGDGRRAFLTLSSKANEAIAAWLRDMFATPLTGTRLNELPDQQGRRRESA